MSRGAHIDAGMGLKIMEQLMHQERELRGAGEKDRITPQGISMGIPELSSVLKIPPETNFAEVYAASRPIVSFAAANQMLFVGLFKDLSPIFTKII